MIPRAILEKPPSAELRPGQMDTDSLPPYEVLDPMVEAYVERYMPTAGRLPISRDWTLALVQTDREADRAERVQAAAGGAGAEGDGKVVRQRAAVSDSS